MATYLTVNKFVSISIMPPEYADAIEQMHPGWLALQLERWSAWLDAKLAKRYATPFASDSPPLVVEEWLARIITHRCYLKRGCDPTDSEMAAIVEDAKDARAEVDEAASSPSNKFELPLRADAPGGQGVVRGAPLLYAEQSPYTWTELQHDGSEGEGWGRF
jgi:hypothetical protein